MGGCEPGSSTRPTCTTLRSPTRSLLSGGRNSPVLPRVHRELHVGKILFTRGVTWSLSARAAQLQWARPAPDRAWLPRLAVEEGQFYPPGSRRWSGPGTNPPRPTWLPKGLADQGTGRLISPDLSLTAAYTQFSPRPWDVRWGRWVACRGCLGRRYRWEAGLVCLFGAAVTSFGPTTPAMLPSGRPGLVGVSVRWAILCYPREGAAGRQSG